MRMRQILIALAGAALLVACAGPPGPTTQTSPGGSGGGGCSATASSPAATISLVPDPSTVGAFSPKTVTVKVGQTVEWKWTDQNNPHTVTADSGSFDSGVCQPGSTFTQTFSTAGSFAYHCSLHQGMVGTITVTS
jgi:plastocyanin